jgi:Tol biopolymer transport system component
VRALDLSKGPTPAVPTPSVRNGPLTAYGYTDCLYSLTPDGRLGDRIVGCTGECTLISGADWSPDGTHVAFAVACAGGCGSEGDPFHGVHIVDPTTGEDRLVVHGEPRNGIDWSADGSRIAYVEDGLIHIVNADGSNPKVVPGTSGVAGSPSWSPDGTKLVYSEDNSDVFVIDVDGSNRRLLAQGREPAWSPDGARIAYRDGCEVRTIAPDGRGSTTIADLSTILRERKGCDRPPADFGFGGGLVWSPDGQEIATIAQGGVFLLHADGSGLERRPRADDYAELAWQPVAP